MSYVLAVASIVSACTAILTVVLLSQQLREALRISARSSEYNFLDSSKYRVLEMDASTALINLRIEPIARRLDKPLTKDEAIQIADDPAAHYAFNYLLNELQNLCVAREFDLVSAPVFDRVHAKRIQWWSRFLLSYITLMQCRLHDDNLWDCVLEAASS